MKKVCSLCHKEFNEGVDVPKGYLLKVDLPPYTYWECYDCAKAVGDPRAMTLRAPASLGKGLLRDCDRCHKHLPARQVLKHPTEHLHLCPTCTAKVDATNAKSTRPSSELLGNTVHKRTSKIDGGVQRRLAELREKEIELRRQQNEFLRDSGRPFTLGDELKVQARDRAYAVAKALSANVGFFDGGSLQDHQRMNKRAEAIQRQSKLPRPVAYGSLGALQNGQRNSRKADGLSGSAPGDASAAAEQVAATDRSMPRSYSSYEPSRRDDYFSDILPGSAATSDPARDYYPDSANLRPDWVPEGDANPRTIADANQRDTGGIRLFSGNSSAYFKPASPTVKFVGSDLVVRTPSRPQVDVAKFAMDLALRLRRGPKFFGKNL
jgi:hypothetical protein